MTRIMGIDPGLARCGLAVIDTDGISHRFVRGECFESSGDITDTMRLISDKRVARARLLRDFMAAQLRAWTPDVVALEEFGFLRGQHATACLAMAYMTIVCECDARKVPIVACTAATWRDELSGLRGRSQRTSTKGMTKAQALLQRKLDRNAREARTKEREQRSHIEALRRVEGAYAIEVRFSKQARVHVLDGLGISCWAIHTPTVKRLTGRG